MQVMPVCVSVCLYLSVNLSVCWQYFCKRINEFSYFFLDRSGKAKEALWNILAMLQIITWVQHFCIIHLTERGVLCLLATLRKSIWRGELWIVFCENFEEIWPHINGIALYNCQFSRSPDNICSRCCQLHNIPAHFFLVRITYHIWNTG